MAAVTVNRRPSRILFASCNSQDYPQPLWPSIRSRNATAFVWAGDAIYADTTVGIDFTTFPPRKKIQPGTPQLLRELYLEQRQHEEYSQLVKETYIFGTIDDHDYGLDNADRTFPYRRESGIEFVDTFLGLRKTSPMSKRAYAGEGVYGVAVFDFARPEGQELLTDEEAGLDPDVIASDESSTTLSDKSVAVFVLDVRSNKSPWGVPDGDFLGPTQWAWFEQALARSTASVNVVVNGLQVHADKYHSPDVHEAWRLFPASQTKLYHLLLNKASTPIIISGDVHHASLGRKDCVSQDGSESRALPEMTTSGMTHSWGVHFCSRPSFVCKWWYTTWTLRTCMHLGHLINPWTELLIDQGREGAKSGLQYSLDLNYGELEFDWESRLIRARVMGVEKDIPLLSLVWDMDKSTFKKTFDDSWQCSNYRGPPNEFHHRIAKAISISLIPLFFIAPVVLTLVAMLLGYRHLIRRRG
jgi:alkaline phosphatase D